MNDTKTAFELDRISQAIENGELVLPTLPDNIIKIQGMLDDINVSANQIVMAISTDPALVAQLIRTANSAAYSDKPKVSNVMGAVSRLGYRMLRNLIITTAMVRLSSTNHPTVQRYMVKLWEHSREVAAISHVLARTQIHLNHDQAMLAGLIHDIGALPICSHASTLYPELDDTTLLGLVRKFHVRVGETLLKAWGFPQELVEVIALHEDLHHESGTPHASYSDIVTVANMLNQATSKVVKWDNIAAVKRLRLSPETLRSFFEQFEKELRTSREMLFQN